MFCYTAVFFALINHLDALRTYIQNGFFNSEEECESSWVQYAKKHKSDLDFKITSEGLVGFYSGKDGKTYYQCTKVLMSPEVLCEKGLLDKALGTYENCDCSRLNHETKDLKK